MKGYPEPLVKEEMDRIIEASMDDDFFYMLFIVAKKTGKRLGELYDVKVKDIDFDRKIMITKILKRRRRVEKETILPLEVIPMIMRWIIKEKLKLDDYVFRKVGYRQIQNRTKSYGKKAGLTKNISFHNFRHYFVTELVRKGWTWDQIIKLTGHASPASLVSYDHTTAIDIEEKAREDIKDI